MAVLRTPDERFAGLPGFPFTPHYVVVDGLRLHVVDEGQGDPILCLHGEPTWSYLYRQMIPPLAADHRALALDFPGFGRSDKPGYIADYTFPLFCDSLAGVIAALDLKRITLVVQDWGGLIGLTVAGRMPERFARLVIMNTGLPTGEEPLGEAFMRWREFAVKMGRGLPVGRVIRGGLVNGSRLPEDVVAAYEAPFPDERYKAGVAAFPLLVPLTPNDPGAAELKTARDALSRWKKPTLVMFSDGDPLTQAGRVFFRRLIPAAKEQPRLVICDAGHFLQEEKGIEIAANIIDFIARTPLDEGAPVENLYHD